MSDELRTVVVRGLPLAIHLEAESHAATVRRELALVHTADERGEPPERLLWLSHHLGQRYDRFTAAQKDAVERGLADGEDSSDLRFEVPVDAAEAAEQMARVLEEIDAYCRSGDLVTLAASETVLAYQRWFLEVFVGQLRDERPAVSWKDWRDTDADAAASTVTVARADDNLKGQRAATLAINEDLDLEGSAEIRRELVTLLEDGVADLTVDLSNCAFIDSVGISLLLTTLETLEHADGRLVVVGATGRTRSVLKTAGVFDVLTRGR